MKLDTRPPILFAHPSEAEIARLLDFYGVVWEYEPRSFPLEWNEDGSPHKSFSPDFYLPDYDLFLEVTTVKPSLIHRKNRKIRRFRELYPDVPIKLLTLKDMEALLLKYQRGEPGKETVEVERSGDTRKSLSEEDDPADCMASNSFSSPIIVVPTDLSTHQDQTKSSKR